MLVARSLRLCGFFLVLFSLVACADSGSDSSSNDGGDLTDGIVSPGFPGGDPDAGTPMPGTDVESDPGADGLVDEDTALSDAQEEDDVEVGEDAGGEGNEEPDVVDDASSEEDTSSSGDVVGPTGPAEVGEPCGGGIECVEGASCLEVEDGSIETQCYEDVEQGGPCGPGIGLCVPGTNCVTPPDGGDKVCQKIVEEGSSCADPSVTCPTGQVCVDSTDIVGYDASAQWVLPEGVVPADLLWDDDTQLLWVSDSAGAAVHSFDASGVLQNTITSPELGSPAGIFKDGDTLWIADSEALSVWTVALEEEPVFKLFASGAGVFGPSGPRDVVVRTDNGVSSVFVSAPDLNAVVVLDSQGALAELLGSGEGEDLFSSPRGMEALGGSLWIADRDNSRIHAVSVEGDSLLTIGGTEPISGGLISPVDVSLSSSGEWVFVADEDANKVVVFDAVGGVLHEVSSDDGFLPVSVITNPTGTAFFVANGATNEIAFYEAGFDKVCVPPAGPGEACGNGGAPCATGLLCAEKFEGSGEQVCLAVIPEGGECLIPSGVCTVGTECVRGNAAAGHVSVCLPQAAIGGACGPGLAGCVDGAGCDWEGWAHLTKNCYADVAVGGVCNGYGSGDCVTGSTCRPQSPGDVNHICVPTVGVGADCGPNANVSCHPWLSCNYATSLLDRVCSPFQQAGEICGIGVGACAAGTVCQFQNAGDLAPVCISDSAIGQACGGTGLGNCDDFAAQCILQSAVGPASCLEKSTQDGESCGIYGVAPCAQGTECLVDVIGGSTASCYGDLLGLGTSCGVQFGGCDEAEGFSCSIQDTDNFTGVCATKPADFGECGAFSEGGSACPLLTHGCTCASPFIPMSAGYDAGECIAAGSAEVCVPEVNLYDFCAVNSVDGTATPGWLGLCQTGQTCAATLGFNFGQPVTLETEPVTTLYFQCKPTVGLGQACGLTQECEGGLSCLCGNVACTLLEKAVADQGVCGTALP